MQILYQNRNPQLWNGGDMMKMRKFQKYIREYGHNVEFFFDPKIDLGRFDLVHGYNLNFPWTWEQCRNAKQQHKPFIVSSIYFPGVGINEEIRDVIDYASAIVVFSELERDRIMETHSLPDSYLNKFHIITNGVDMTFYSEIERDKDIDILIVGTIHKRKQQLMAVQLANEFDIIPTVIGSPHDQNYLNMLRGFDMHYHAFMSHEKLSEYYKRAKIILQPSTFDPYPNTLLEGALAGCNVVMTDATYVPDDFPNIHKVSVTDMNQWKKIVKKLLKQKKPNIKSQKYVLKNFRWEDKAKEMIELYEQFQ